MMLINILMGQVSDLGGIKNQLGISPQTKAESRKRFSPLALLYSYEYFPNITPHFPLKTSRDLTFFSKCLSLECTTQCCRSIRNSFAVRRNHCPQLHPIQCEKTRLMWQRWQPSNKQGSWLLYETNEFLMFSVPQFTILC